MTINTSPKTVREQRHAARAARRRTIWIIIGVIALIAVAAGVYLAFFNQPAEPPAPQTSGNPADPVPGVETVTTDSGLSYQDLTPGSGAEAQAGKTVAVALYRLANRRNEVEFVTRPRPTIRVHPGPRLGDPGLG